MRIYEKINDITEAFNRDLFDLNQNFEFLGEAIYGEFNGNPTPHIQKNGVAHSPIFPETNRNLGFVLESRRSGNFRWFFL